MSTAPGRPPRGCGAPTAGAVWALGLCLALLTGCVVPAGSLLPVVALPSTPAGSALLEPAATPAGVLAAAPAEAAAPSETPAATPTYAVTLVAGVGPVAVPTFNSADPLRFTFPTPIVFNTPENWRPPLDGVPLSVRPQDHFWFRRPIASDSVNYPLGSYRYGSDYYGQMHIHAGIDIDAPAGTPVLAAGPGQVIWAGWGLFNFDPRRTDDPYGIAVAIRHDYGFANRNLYTLYAHMEAENRLFVGQRVQAGDVLGWEGSTGNSTGPHLHFEVRVGENGYYSTRNPELWIAPYAGWGVLAGQLLDKAGRYVYSQPIEIYDSGDRLVATVYTYSDRVARPDESWRENFAISDLPAGRYRLRTALGLPAPTLVPPTATASPEPPPGLEGVAAVPEVVVPPEQVVEPDVEVLEAVVEVVPGQTNFVLLQSGLGQVVGGLPAETRTPAYPTDTATPSATPTPTVTLTPSRTPRPSATPTATRTPKASPTAAATRTPAPTATPPAAATRTPAPTATPSAARLPSSTPAP